jgi:hypothetical protein
VGIPARINTDAKRFTSFILYRHGSALAIDWYSFLTLDRFIGGVGVNLPVVAPMYISKFPLNRGRLVALFQFNIVLGI